MKTAVSIADLIFETADQLAKELGISRSELYARALEELIRNRKREHISASINATLASLEPDAQTGTLELLDRGLLTVLGLPHSSSNLDQTFHLAYPCHRVDS